ncbi:MAG: DUF1206 domain-containing protein [Pseudomonadota bacterium]|nr:DUF1206 domain-containing protein [Pseudomonadota bacterium]
MNRSIGASGKAAAHEVASWVPPVARVGYAAKGVVYLLVAWLAIKAGMASGQAGGASEGLASLTDETGGSWMLVAIAAGLLAHVIWRLVQALLDPEHSHTDAKRIAMRIFYALSGVIYGTLAYTAWKLSQGMGGGQGRSAGAAGAGSGNGQEAWIQRLLEQPFGSWLVMAAGLGIIAFGIHQLVKAFRGDVNRRMGYGEAIDRRWLTLLGRIGIAARGVVMVPVGWFVFRAGRIYRAEAAADTGEVLSMLGDGPMLTAVGVGLFAYGLHQIAKAVYRRIERPD